MFDILKNNWIPVTYVTGARKSLGLLAALKDAAKILSIDHVSPLVEFSIYRFIQTFLLDALRPRDVCDLEDMLDEGAFDMQKINDYVDKCKAEGVSFDLFNNEHPFLQTKCSEEDGDKMREAQALDFARASGQNHVFFDHPGSRDDGYTPAEAFQFMLARYIFATMDGKGYMFGVNGPPPLYVWLRGENLFETLVFNLIQVPDDNFDDPPVFWRRKDAVKCSKKKHGTSVLEGMLFPSRRIRLIQDDDGLVRNIWYSAGEACEQDHNFRDPNVVVMKKNQLLRANENTPIWENLCYVVDGFSGICPTVMDAYTNIHFDRSDLVLTLYAVATRQAKFLSAYKRDFMISKDVYADSDKVTVLQSVVARMNETESILIKYLKELPFVSSKSADNKGVKDGVLKNAVSNFHRKGWVLFDSLMNVSFDAERCDEMRDNCFLAIQHEAKRVFNDFVSSGNYPARQVVAVAEVQGQFYKALVADNKKRRKG